MVHGRTFETLSAISPRSVDNPVMGVRGEGRMDPIAVTCESRPGVPQALSVTQLARVIRDTIRANPILSRILVRGEVSNLQRAPSGHVFFTLKDATAQLSCTLFREDAEMLGFDLEDGMDVVVSGDVDVFPRRGSVQLLIKAATPAGVGAFWAAYQKTRKKLAAEGLFDAARKRPLPAFPQRIGVVTSEIVDVVADVRAATPSAAAELVSPDATELMARVNGAGRSLVGEIREALQVARNRMIALRERLSPRGLQRGVEANRALLDRSFAALVAVGPREVTRQRDRLEGLGRRLDVLSPLSTLQRGYAIAEREDGHVVAHAAEVESGDALAVRFQDGRIRVHVNQEQEEP